MSDKEITHSLIPIVTNYDSDYEASWQAGNDLEWRITA